MHSRSEKSETIGQFKKNEQEKEGRGGESDCHFQCVKYPSDIGQGDKVT